MARIMISFEWTEEKRTQIKEYCAENSLSQSEMMRRAIDKTLEGRTF